MQPIKPRWSEQIVLVCNNCRAPGAIKPSCGHHGADELRSWLKDRLKEGGEWGGIRVVTTSCLDVCPSDGVAVSIQEAGEEPELWILDPEVDRENLLARIRGGGREKGNG